MSGEILEIKARCGGCEEEIKPQDFSFEVEEDGGCPGCRPTSDTPQTCMCNGPVKTVEFTCPLCNFFNIAIVI